jgi:hypothetical protein
MIIVESMLRNVVRQELRKVLSEQEAIINVELPQDEEETTITMNAEEIADLASEIADSESEIEVTPEQINTYLSERKIK